MKVNQKHTLNFRIKLCKAVSARLWILLVVCQFLNSSLYAQSTGLSQSAGVETLVNAQDAGASKIEHAAQELSELWSLHTQATLIEQRKNNFHSPYFSSNSLLNQSQGDRDRSYTLSVTGYLGIRLWSGAQAYYNPEIFEGTPFSSALVGLGGFQNGELQKGMYIPGVAYSARAFIRQTIGLGGEQENIASDVVNQLATSVDKNRLVFTWGKVASLDFFDMNTYSHDPRIQFLNFSIFSSAAYGYAADAKGFTYGLVTEWYQGDWVLRAGRLAVPKSPNTMELDYTLTKDYVDQLEITHSHSLIGKQGSVRALVFRQYAYMANYQDAITQGIANNTTPNIYSARVGYQSMFGYAVNVEQAINTDLGIFARWSWNNDQTETQTLDVGRSLSLGASLRGNDWGRGDDIFGVAVAVNAVSDSEVQYLQRGGLTMFIGDGAIDYKTEQIFETYYSAKLKKALYISADYQHILNPAYNSSRGPVNVVGVRLHYEI